MRPPQPQRCGPPIEREPEEPDSYPDNENLAERATRVTSNAGTAEPSYTRVTSPLWPPSPGEWVDPAVLSAAIDEAAQRVGESDLPRTAAALYGIALRESQARPAGDPLRAMATAYARGAAEAVDEAQARRHRPSCAPVRHLPALAFHIARRELSGEGPPPWPERRSNPSTAAIVAPARPRLALAVGATARVVPERVPAAQPAEPVNHERGDG
jgi:hypothetical protein